jgi:twinkle protein
VGRRSRRASATWSSALGCKHIYLDHLTALAAGEEDEKQALDKIMAELAGSGAGARPRPHFISHLATPEGKPHEEGGRVTIRHFRGSRSIGFWSHFMFGLERNQQAEDEIERAPRSSAA